MYESYWQLQQKPFENSADPRFYYPGESHQAALLKLRYAVENRLGGALLAGVSGSGKTLVVNMLRDVLGEQCAPFLHLVFPQMSTPELLAYLAGELSGADGGPQQHDTAQSIRRIGRFLRENTRSRRHAVVVVDEAHLIESAETLEALRLLLNFEAGGRPNLTLLLAGQTGLLPTLDRMPQLEERLGVKCLTRPFSEQETAAYVSHRLKVAGAVREIFEPDALPVLHALTNGVPRRINRLCDLSLLIGFAEERSTITAAHFESVSQELVAVVPE
ncbi:MAG: AAA family ATPase [Pirellulales bacterium]|nr:AAA family ATPase [Pirellulales bacterium]